MINFLILGAIPTKAPTPSTTPSTDEAKRTTGRVDVVGFIKNKILKSIRYKRVDIIGFINYIFQKSF